MTTSTPQVTSPRAVSPIGEPAFWDRIADKYARRPVADEAAYRHKLEVTERYLRPDMQLLEFGCGTGSTALVHAPKVRSIQALDISSQMIAIARRKAAAAGVHNVSFEQSTLDALVAPDQRFDMVLGHNILHLLCDPYATIERVHRLLEPSGLFVSSTACLGDAWRYAPLRLALPLMRYLGRAPYVRFLRERDLLDCFERCGFDVEYRWQPAPARTVFLVVRKRA